MTIPNGAAGVDTANGIFLISADANGDTSVADLASHNELLVRNAFRDKYVTNDPNSVLRDPSGVLGLSVTGLQSIPIPQAISNAQDSASYALAQLAVMNRLIVDLFDSASPAFLSGSWDVNYFGFGGGNVYQDGSGNCAWNQFGGITYGVNCRWNADQTVTDNQISSTILGTKVASPLAGGQSWNRLYCRVNDAGTPDTGVFGQVTDADVSIGRVVSGTTTLFPIAGAATTIPVTMAQGDMWDFIAGVGTTGDDPYTFVLKRNGVQVASYIDTGHASVLGAGYRSVAFGMQAASANPLILQILPGRMAVFSADDH